MTDLPHLLKSQVKASSTLGFKAWISSCLGLETLFRSEQLQKEDSGMLPTKTSMHERGLNQQQHMIAQDKEQTRSATLTKSPSN